MIHTQSDQIHKVHVYIIHMSEPHTGCCPPLPHWVGVSLLSISPLACVVSRLVCLWVGIRLVLPAAESRSPGYRSACKTHVLTHLGPHPRRCPGEWTPHPEKPQNKIHLDHIVTQFHTLNNSITLHQHTRHHIQDTLRALLDNQGNIEVWFLLRHKIKIIVKSAVESWSIFNSLLLVLKNYRGSNVILHKT